jgi:nicotinamidase-related amidase
MNRKHVSPADTAIVLIDHAVGFANLFRSHTVADNANAAVSLAKMATVFKAPLVVTSGPDDAPSGPLYPQLKAVIGDHPIVIRQGAFDAFDEDVFARAVEATERKRLVMAGLFTEGCLLQTALTGIARGYEVFAVLDASAGETQETHQTAVLRMIQGGVIPTTWFSIASEFQRTWANVVTLQGFSGLIANHDTNFAMQGALNASQLAQRKA